MIESVIVIANDLNSNDSNDSNDSNNSSPSLNDSSIVVLEAQAYATMQKMNQMQRWRWALRGIVIE